MKQCTWALLALFLSIGLTSCSPTAKLKGGTSAQDSTPDKDAPKKIPSIDAPEEGDQEGLDETSDTNESTVSKSGTSVAAVKPSLLKGRVRNAQNAEAISGANISIFNAKGELLGKPFNSTPSGTFPIPDLPPGEYKLKVTASGYIDADKDFSVVADQAKIVDVLMSTILSGSTFRAVLSWGSVPQDLDAHMKIIDIATGAVVSDIYYDNYTFEDVNIKAVLDIDNVRGAGPETVTFDILRPGKYKLQFFVNNFDGVAGADGDILVQLFQGNAVIGAYTLPAKTQGLTGYWNWTAFEIGATANVVPVKAFGAPFSYDNELVPGARSR